MVCFVNGNLNLRDERMTEKSEMAIEVIQDDDEDDLTFQRVAGGSVIEYSPIISPNEEILFVLCAGNVRMFSVTTGDWIRDLEGIGKRKLIGHQFDPHNSKLFYGCTEVGDIISWKWKSGVINEKVSLRFARGSKPTVLTFSLIPMKLDLYALITWRNKGNANVQFGIFSLKDGFRQELRMPLELNSKSVKVSVGWNGNYFAIAQDNFVHFVDIRGRVKSRRNIAGNQLTCVACHPVEDAVMTGDVTGRLLLYRQLFHDGDPMTTLYHWHHTSVNTVAFTPSGSHFYSSAAENVLVKWNIKDLYKQEFLPRMWGSAIHISIENQKVAVALDDNEIQILNAQNELISIIQNFTWLPNDKTNIPKFPIGLKVNPRTSCLVLNGRVGHLQFYSTHTKNHLFNLDTTIQNRLNIETEKILYNTYVSHAALNMDWLATAELLDDKEYTLESRLKFWKFDLKKQGYVLNSQIELPHENGLRALEFSTPYSVDNLLCASCGEFDVKVWALEESGNIHRKGIYWTCIGKVSYKNLPINSLSFSLDTSLLSIGFGNTLCVYLSHNLRLKCILSAPAGMDGSANKLSISLPKSMDKSDLEAKQSQFIDCRKKMQVLIKTLLEENNTKPLLNQIRVRKVGKKKSKNTKILNLSIDEKELIFSQVLASNELSLFQKINIFDKFNLRARTPINQKTAFEEYCNSYDIKTLSNSLFKRIMNLSPKHRFQYCHRFESFRTRHPASKNVTASFKKNFNFIRGPENAALTNGFSSNTRPRKRTISSSKDQSADKKSLNIFKPNKQTTQINHVVFCTGDFMHLVIVCTESRLLIWNLLTLRLQSSYKISVDKISVDLYSSLVAVFTREHDFYVFLPNTPLPLYQRKCLPQIYGMAWIPRRYSKSRSLTVDWQATTELYFLSENQELLRLVSCNDMESFNTNASYLSDSLQPLPFTPFATMIAKQQQNYATSNDQDNRMTNNYSVGVLGRNSIKELAGLQTHTMVPVSLLCNKFLKSLLMDVEKMQSNEKLTDDGSSDDENDSDSDSDVKMNSDGD